MTQMDLAAVNDMDLAELNDACEILLTRQDDAYNWSLEQLTAIYKMVHLTSFN